MAKSPEKPMQGRLVSYDETKNVFRMIFNFGSECYKVKVFAVDKRGKNFYRLAAESNKMKLTQKIRKPFLFL